METNFAALGILLVIGIVFMIIDRPKQFKDFDLEMQQLMKDVNEFDRFMDASGQYDTKEERKYYEKWEKEIEEKRKLLSNDAKDFMEYVHWRFWNNEENK